MARRDRRRTTGALAASILVHLVLLFMVLRVAGSSPRVSETRAESDFQIQLVASPPAAEPAPPAAAPARPASTAPRAALAGPARRAPAQARPVRPPPDRAVQPLAPVPRQAPRPAAAPQGRPAAPLPAAGVQAGGGAQAPGLPAGGGRWAVQGEDEDGGGVRRFLRATVGCSHAEYVGLSEAERADCDRRIGEQARSIGIAPDKLAGFIAAAEAQERQRAERTGPLRDLFVPCRGEGSNLDRGCLNTRLKHPEDGP